MDNNTKIEEQNENEAAAKIGDGLDELCSALCKIDDVNLMKDFFACLLTPAELSDIAMRWLLVREIDKGTTQREIARMFGMSLCKITRGSRELKKENSAFRQVLDIYKQIQEGRQAYIVCPLVEDNEEINAKSVLDDFSGIIFPFSFISI